MKVELISIGDELLIGQTINTNAAWLGAQLKLRGIEVNRCITISDTKDAIIGAIDDSFQKVDLVIVTGGLGPTKDDITKVAIAEYFKVDLELHQETLDRVTAFFEARGREMLEVNKLQAMIPQGCKVLENNNGTAPGMYIQKDAKVLISLPGVPYEMKSILLDGGFDAIAKEFEVNALYHKTAFLQGVGESYVADRMEEWENEIRSKGLGLAYLPSPGIVRIRISSNSKEDATLIDHYFAQLEEAYSKHVFGYNEASLSQVVGDLLREKNMTIGTAESCTSGAISAEIVSVAGASEYYQGSLNTYSNELKHSLLNVPMEYFTTVGAVSQEVVETMALNAKEVLNVDYSIAVSGIAGPGGGTDEKPVGTIWIAIATPEKVWSKKFNFGNNRERNIILTVNTALNLLRCELLGLNDEKK